MVIHEITVNQTLKRTAKKVFQQFIRKNVDIKKKKKKNPHCHEHKLRFSAWDKLSQKKK